MKAAAPTDAFPEGWRAPLSAEARSPQFDALLDFLREERAQHRVFPPETLTYAALALTPPAETRVVLLGQDPYHGEGQAHGLSFSVQTPNKPPPSLANIFKELVSDIGCPRPGSGDLTPWAKQGVLLLNTVLTVRAHEANSHRSRGWEPFTDAIIRFLSAAPRPLVFLLWGAPARKKRALIDGSRHHIIETSHPSPLSAYRGFLGSKVFSRTNAALISFGHAPLRWELP